MSVFKKVRLASALALGSLLWACAPASASPDPPPSPSQLRRRAAPPPAEEPSAPQKSVAAPAPSGAPAAPPRPPTYPWLADVRDPVARDSLEQRFPPPAGATRVALDPGSFGAWLRRLPLFPSGTAVVSFSGQTILPPAHENLAAVVAIDVSPSDLQQCADSIIRLHAEWAWSIGRRDQSYRSAAGPSMPWERWRTGARMKASGQSLEWVGGTDERPISRHGDFRQYLDAVFMFANTGSLARDGLPVAAADAQPGDFFVKAGAPGHAVLILDMARAPDGHRHALLGQGFMPAQSFHVLRPSVSSAWYDLDADPEGVTTPFWPRFAWKTLRRMP